MLTSYVAFTPGIPKELLRRGLPGAWGKRLATVLGTKEIKKTVRKIRETVRVTKLRSIMVHKNLFCSRCFLLGEVRTLDWKPKREYNIYTCL